MRRGRDLWRTGRPIWFWEAPKAEAPNLRRLPLPPAAAAAPLKFQLRNEWRREACSLIQSLQNVLSHQSSFSSRRGTLTSWPLDCWVKRRTRSVMYKDREWLTCEFMNPCHVEKLCWRVAPLNKKMSATVGTVSQKPPNTVQHPQHQPTHVSLAGVVVQASRVKHHFPGQEMWKLYRAQFP